MPKLLDYLRLRPEQIMVETFLDRITRLEQNVTTIMSMLGLPEAKPNKASKPTMGSTRKATQGPSRLKRGDGTSQLPPSGRKTERLRRGEGPKRILSVLTRAKKALTVAQMHEQLGAKDFHDNSMRASLAVMAKAGTVTKNKDGTWAKA
jgi:hypothetical protein